MECVICLDPLTKEGLVTLHCGHLFHSSCLEKTLENNAACPTCRKAASKEQMIKIYLDNDGALGECKDCAENTKELEKCFEQTDKMVKDQSKLEKRLEEALEHSKIMTLDYSKLQESERDVKEWARYLETRNEELTKTNNELKEEKEKLLVVHCKETKSFIAEEENLRGKIKNLTEEHQTQVEGYKNETQKLVAQNEILRKELEREKKMRKDLEQECNLLRVRYPGPRDSVPKHGQAGQNEMDIMQTPARKSVEIIEYVSEGKGSQKPKRGRRDEKDPDFSIEMVSLESNSDSDAVEVSPIKRSGRKRTARQIIISDSDSDNDSDEYGKQLPLSASRVRHNSKEGPKVSKKDVCSFIH